MTPIELDRDVCYRAIRTRDARFDGRFYTGVVSTGIYCRPICPARTPKLDNCIFLPSAGAAHQMGFRPCLRCRPEVAPGLAGFRGTASTVSRALALIAEGSFDEGGVEELAGRLGVGARHLRRLFDRHVGASPVSVAQAHRILFAKQLIVETSLGMAEIAMASGFGSVRRFNDAFQQAYGRPPSALRRSQRTAGDPASGVVLALPFSPPYDWDALRTFLEARAIPGVERVTSTSYERTFVLGGAVGSLSVSRGAKPNRLSARIRVGDVSKLAQVVARLRRLFDLDAPAAGIDAQLSCDPTLATLVRERPGIRVPGAWDPFELAVRAVVGQQVSVRAATTFAGRIVERFGAPLAGAAPGEPDRLFPPPERLAVGDLGQLGLTRSRAANLGALARAVAADPTLLTPGETLGSTVTKLCALPGVGPWTAHYIAMRALGEPDALPSADLGLLRAISRGAIRATGRELERRAEVWSPWRAYAVMRLWVQSDTVTRGERRRFSMAGRDVPSAAGTVDGCA